MEVDWHDLSGNRQLILEVLADRDDPHEGITGSEIKKRLEEKKGEELSNSYVYPNLDALQELGLVRREDDVKRGKAIENYLTEDGVQLLLERSDEMNRLAHRLATFQRATEARNA